MNVVAAATTARAKPFAAKAADSVARVRSARAGLGTGFISGKRHAATATTIAAAISRTAGAARPPLPPTPADTSISSKAR